MFLMITALHEVAVGEELWRYFDCLDHLSDIFDETGLQDEELVGKVGDIGVHCCLYLCIAYVFRLLMSHT